MIRTWLIPEGWRFDAALLVAPVLLLLLPFTALALGAVHLWAYRLMEALLFILGAVWMVSVFRESTWPMPRRAGRGAERLLGRPALCLLLFTILQMTPLPPPALQVISPATYQLYTVSFPGWPQQAPYRALRAAWRSAPAAQSPSAPASDQPSADSGRTAAALPALGLAGTWRWRPLALAPMSAVAATLELLACGVAFALVLFFPFGLIGAEREAEARFYRRLTFTLVATGVMVALLGLAEQAWWNGKLLWFVVPRDWRGSLPAHPRASGPFVDPDHFADYLAMVMPLAAVGALFPLSRRDQRAPLEHRLAAAVAVLVMAVALSRSLSRGGWLAAAMGVTVAIFLSFRHSHELAPALFARNRRAASFAIIGSVLGCALLAGVAMLLTGPAGRTDANTRLSLNLARLGIDYKLITLRGSFAMIRDFPLWGVGLGGWPEFIARYLPPPWLPFFFREAENDYVQLIAELGLIGFGLVGWLLYTIARAAHAAKRNLRSHEWPLAAGLAGGIAAAAVHELGDFSLHTPANALLLTVIGAAWLRLVLREPRRAVPAQPFRVAGSPSRVRLAAAGAAIVFLALTLAALVQPDTAYPYAIGNLATLAEAERAVVEHPADARVHVALATLIPAIAPAALRDAEYRAAVWLNPADPAARDLEARNLLLERHEHRGLAEITLSIQDSPSLETHFYLHPDTLPWLLPNEQAAIADGFARAVAAHYADAGRNLGAFYDALGRYSEAAAAYEHAARTPAVGAANDPATTREDLDLAGRAYVKAADLAAARPAFQQAIAASPADWRPSADLIASVLGPQHDLVAVRAVAARAIAAGADATEIDLALAAAGQAANAPAMAVAALEDALHTHPDFSTTMRIGEEFVAAGRSDRAALAFGQAIAVYPGSAEGYFELAEAEEDAYNYAAAARNYALAVALDGNNQAYRQRYHDFRERLAKSSATLKTAGGMPAPPSE